MSANRMTYETYDIRPFIDSYVVKGDRYSHLDHALQHVEPGDHLLEFGVWRGGTINAIAKRFPEHPVHGFDSFEGLPEKWYLNKRELVTGTPKHDTGTFAMKALPVVRSNVQLHKGYFEDSLPTWVEDQPKDFSISLLHIDSDLYSSAKYVLTTLNGHIRPGTVVIFDDFYRWDAPFVYELWADGEYKALKEWLAENDREIEILCRSEIGWQTAVRVLT